MKLFLYKEKDVQNYKNLSIGKELKNTYHMVNLKLYRRDDASGDGQDQDNYQDKEYTTNYEVPFKDF